VFLPLSTIPIYTMYLRKLILPMYFTSFPF
jgi:hypothetical protein